MKVCSDCGLEPSNGHLNSQGRCLECASKALQDAMEQMAKREGPFFKKWLDAKQKAITNYRYSMEKAVKKYAEALDAVEYSATPLGEAEMIVRIGNLSKLLEEE